MTTIERNNAGNAARIIQTLCVLFLAILLKGYTTGHIGGQWTLAIFAVIAGVFIGNAFYWNGSK